MEILIAIELMIGVIFVLVFGSENLRQDLSRLSYQRPLYPNDDDSPTDDRSTIGSDGERKQLSARRLGR